MGEHPVHRLTSIGRPLDPAYPTNLAVLLLMPAAAIGFAILAWAREQDGAGVAWSAVVGVAATLGCWALARELAPDDDPAAFVSLAFGLGAVALVEASSLLLLFTALALVRVVNRSTGLAPRWTDSTVVAGLGIAVAHTTGSPLLGAVAALAFGCDALLRDGRKAQWIFAAICATAAALLAMRHGPGFEAVPTGSRLAAVSLIAALTGVAIARTRVVVSTGDVGASPLSVRRVRAGMSVGLLVAAQAATHGNAGAATAAAVWATLAGVGLAALRPRRGGPRTPQ